eukprot:366080-Chlamydomonas_euryale.AAC.12
MAVEQVLNLISTGVFCVKIEAISSPPPPGTGSDGGRAVEQVPDLILAGVSCFKIEGRLKGPEYVSLTTHTYRAAVDAAWDAMTATMDIAEQERARRGAAFGETETDAAAAAATTLQAALEAGHAAVLLAPREQQALEQVWPGLCMWVWKVWGVEPASRHSAVSAKKRNLLHTSSILLVLENANPSVWKNSRV